MKDKMLDKVRRNNAICNRQTKLALQKLSPKKELVPHFDKADTIC